MDCFDFQVPDIVRSIEGERVMALRQQSQLLWHMYFSSIDRIIFTALEVISSSSSSSSSSHSSKSIFTSLVFLLFCFPNSIATGDERQIVRQRIDTHIWKDGTVWNSFPGGLLTLANFSDTPSSYPWAQRQRPVATRAPPAAEASTMTTTTQKFTALIYAQQASGFAPASNAVLLRLLRTVARSSHVSKV